MLQTLFVKDFAIVGEAEIGFRPGLTVVTGETGAGKSLLVDALLLLAGQRAEAGVVRHGCERAELIAEFDLGDAPAAAAWLAAEEFDDDGACQLRRVIRSEGSSRAWINGRPATLSQLQALGEKLLEVHGQHASTVRCSTSASQLSLLDAYGDHDEALRRVAAIAAQWRRIDAQMRALDQRRRSRRAHRVARTRGWRTRTARARNGRSRDAQRDPSPPGECGPADPGQGERARGIARWRQ